MQVTSIYEATIYFSYNQMLVYDSSEKLPACAWTQSHFEQGFARRSNTVCIGTPLEFGRAIVRVFIGKFNDGGGYTRAIEVPFEVSSGQIAIGGPEDFEGEHRVALSSGHYRLVAAQSILDDAHAALDLFLEQMASPLAHSRVLVKDDEMNPANPLLETSEIA
jgi:hypothetical protein